MDEQQSKILGILCQPERCRTCKDTLIKGINWYISKKHRLCKLCDNVRSTQWCKDNPEKSKIRNKRNSNKLNSKFSAGKKSARLRKVLWTLTKEEFKLIISKPCYYCGHELPKTGVGLDQIVASRGYTVENVVPCCTQCNQSKNSYFTLDEMLLIGKVIKEIKDKRKLENR